MSDQKLMVFFSGVGGDDVGTPALDLYQDLDEELLAYPSLADVNQMIAYARVGKSAYEAFRNNPYIKVSADGERVFIKLPFFVRFYPETLSYTLESNVGVISEKTVVEKAYSGSTVIPMADQIQFGGELNLLSLEWVSNVYNSRGDLISPPEYAVSGNVINFTEQIFGVVKLKYVLEEHSYDLTIEVPKTAVYETAAGDKVLNQSIVGDNPVVMATYSHNDSEYASELNMDYPKIVTDFLETCQYGDRLVIDWGSSSIGNKYLTTYYYSTCDGEVLDIHREVL